MASSNSKPPILDLGDLLPATRPVGIIRSGEKVVLAGFVFGPRCPGTVKSEVADAQAEFVQSGDADDRDEDGNLNIKGRALAESAYRLFNRRILRALLPDLTFAEADVLSSDDDLLSRTLEYLGVERKVVGVADEAESDNPPAEAVQEEGPTTESSSPTSPLSMVPATGSRSRSA